jgi:hypothetical protein
MCRGCPSLSAKRVAQKPGISFNPLSFWAQALEPDAFAFGASADIAGPLAAHAPMKARMGSKPLDCEPDMRMNVHLSYAGTER